MATECIVPPVFLVVFTGAVQYLALVGQGITDVTWRLAASKSFGNGFSWTCVGLFALWAILWLQLPSRQVYGPPTLSGYRPPYQGNGVLYYWASLVAFFLTQSMYPGLASAIFANMPELLGTLNVVALTLCALLLVKGKSNPPPPSDRLPARPLLYEFYVGLELHPRVLGMDVKQLTNCRIGMMGWQLLILSFYLAGVQRHGFNVATLVNLLLQVSGYFGTLDIILDRAGYYICWGCLVWLPCLYTFSSYYLVTHVPVVSTISALLIGLLGLFSILLNYRVDYEKQLFRRASEGKCELWGEPARFIEAQYKDSSGAVHTSKLLLSGFWGRARHFNYTFELLAALSWCLPGLGLGVWPFLYFIFLTILLVHRTFRDEVKCEEKYGHAWERYCREVPYRLVPHVF
ncbi:7-dehydrocholesterol reductase [Blattella germanica]|nr:7-dehydrocholesterol reductase [Blattella germanica]